MIKVHSHSGQLSKENIHDAVLLAHKDPSILACTLTPVDSFSWVSVREFPIHGGTPKSSKSLGHSHSNKKKKTTMVPWSLGGSPSQINRYAGHCFTGREQQPREFRREFQRWESESAEFRARVRQVLPI